MIPPYLSPQEIRKIDENIEMLKPIMTENDVRMYLYWKYKNDIKGFGKYFLLSLMQDKKLKKYIKSPFFHDELRNSYDSKGNTLVVCPRGHGKTTSEIIYLVHNICYEKDPSILLIMAEGLGIETIGKIRDIFETNEDIKFVFGQLVPSRKKEDQTKKWNDSLLIFMNGVNLETVGPKGKTRGKRPTLLLTDDPQENRDVENEEITDKFNHWFFSSAYNTLEDTGRCVVIGTVVGTNCLVNFIEQTKNFNVIKYFAVSNPEFKTLDDGKIHLVGGELLWKERRTLETLDQRLQVIGLEIFMQEYMHVPYIMNGRPVFARDIDYKIIKPIDSYEEWKIYEEPQDKLVAGIDIAEGGPEGDYSTVCIKNEHGHTVAELKGKYDEKQLAKKIDEFENYERDGKKYLSIYIPENNVGQAFINECEKYDWYYKMTLERQKEGIDKNELKGKLGFRTSQTSKELIIREFRTSLTEGIKISEDCYNEILTYAYKNGSANAIRPYHDDLLLANMISLWGVLHEPHRIEYSMEDIKTEDELEEMSFMERFHYKLKHPEEFE